MLTQKLRYLLLYGNTETTLSTTLLHYSTKFEKNISNCNGVEGHAPGEIFDFQRLSHAI